MLVLLWAASLSIASATCPSFTEEAFSKLEEPEQWLKAHNFLRCRHGQPPLQWDEQVARNAAQWANVDSGGKYGHTNRGQKEVNGRMEDDDCYQNNPPSGENIAGGKGPFETTLAWYGEVEDYRGGEKCAPHKMCGHFTALMWESTTLLGCAINPRGKWITGETETILKFAVCQYAQEAPNIMTKYDKNLPPDRVPVNDDATCCAKIFGGNHVHHVKHHQEVLAPESDALVPQPPKEKSRINELRSMWK